MLVEKTDRLYRNLKDWVTVDELDVELHFPKEGVVLSRDSHSSEKFMHGIKVLMAKNYIDNLSEGTSTVHAILRNRIYTGGFDWNGKAYDGRHKALLSVDLWE